MSEGIVYVLEKTKILLYNIKMVAALGLILKADYLPVILVSVHDTTGPREIVKKLSRMNGVEMLPPEGASAWKDKLHLCISQKH